MDISSYSYIPRAIGSPPSQPWVLGLDSSSGARTCLLSTRLAPTRGICSLPSCDWLLLEACAPSPRAIGSY
eukprot:676089-Prorocentrum_minimum.AAC.1